MRSILLGVLLSVAASTTVLADGVIIKCERPCAAAKAAVEKAGGVVTHEYKYVDAIAAELSYVGVSKVGRILPAGSVRKDVEFQQPQAALDRDGTPLSVEIELEADAVASMDAADVVALAAENPDAYVFNNGDLGLSALHADGNTGAGVRVAVIDSGLRPGVLTMFGKVLGGEDFVGDGLTYLNAGNGTHGTFVGGMIANSVYWTLGATSSFRPSLEYNCPQCFISTGQLPMIGSAPGSQIYALRVFAPTGGAPESRIIAAMERVLELRENFDNGMAETPNPDGSYSALNIGVCNMSLGGSTFHAGRDIEDQLTKAFLERDIVLVTSAGNNGPSGTTGGSPGTGFASLTVGAASTATHERILRGIQYGAAIGPLYRPSSATQTAYFSSRGPTADGRPDPEVTANGLASFSSSGGTGLSISSGTSFSAPTVSGVAAVLRQAFPEATARQIRNAIILGADPTVLGDNSGPNDQGFGHVDAASAAAYLESGAVPDTDGLEGGTAKQVNVNMVQGAGIQTWSDEVTRSATLLPGERLETYYKVGPNTAAVVVSVSGVTPGEEQNVLFGDDVILSVHTAKTSAIGSSGDYPVFAVTTGGTWTIPNPDTGLMRVTLTGDWTNASAVGATVSISSVKQPVSGLTSQKKIVEGDLVAVPFTVPAGAGELSAHLEWSADWGAYPANDLDLILVSPSGAANFSAATINSPERASIATPAEGTWTAVVQGYSVPIGDERYKLVIKVDGKAVK